MGFKEDVEKAIGMHAQWKIRLKQAIDTGSLDIPVAKIQVDNECAFGKWLHDPVLPGNLKASPQYQTILTLHAEFHKIAGKVAKLAMEGKKDLAAKELEIGGEFTQTSTKLTLAMMDWKNSLP